jgi:PEP-CTERM motif
MVVRVHPVASVAALAIAACPFSAHAQELSPTPNLGCTTPTLDALAGGTGGTVNTINWGDGLSLGAPNVLVDALPAVQFGCSANMFSVPVQGSMFEVNFGTPGTVPGFDMKWSLATTEYKELKLDVQFTVTEFDIFANAYKIIPGADEVFDHKDFIGVKLDSAFGDSQVTNPDTPLFIDAISHKLILDPNIPGGTGTVELTNTPGPPVPEPATFALFGTGLLAAARVLRRKSRR